MTFDKVNRRVHLYGALVLLPWFLMYGLSSYPIAHHGLPPVWKLRYERDYTLPAVGPGADLDTVAASIAREGGVSGSYGAYRTPGGDLQVWCPRFLGPIRMTYFEKTHRLRVEDQQFRFANFLTAMHTRGGFEKGSFLEHVWAVLVDIASLAVIVWVASGIFMWWSLKRLRFWGWVALGGGLASFAVFLLAL